MSKKEKYVPLIFIMVLLFLIAQMIFLLLEHFDYEDRKQAGNARWQQVEERIHELEVKCGRND